MLHILSELLGAVTDVAVQIINVFGGGLVLLSIWSWYQLTYGNLG